MPYTSVPSSSAAGEPGAAPEGLRITLRDAEPAAEPPAAVEPARATPLDDADLARLLARLPALEPRAGDERPFALRPGSVAPPRPGTALALPFPPPEEREAPPPPGADARALEVLRSGPEGEVPIAASLFFTFSAPMVAVGSHQAAGATLPARITPASPGRWRWVGDRTLLFEAEGRFPMATSYEVEVPAGTTSLSGGRLGAAHRLRFSTPPPRLTSHHPGGRAEPLTPLLVLGFDQRIDPGAIAELADLRSGSRRHPVVQAAAAEIEADPTVRALVTGLAPERRVVLRPASPLPAATDFELVIPPGTPSAEGPRTTGEPQKYAFRTHGPMVLVDRRCEPCTPGQPWALVFSNPVDRRSLSVESFRVEPEVPGLALESWGSTVAVRGRTRGRTTYRLRVPASLRDVYGQTLGQDRTVEFSVGPAEATLFPLASFLVLDPGAPARLPVHTINQERLRVRAYRVGPADWEAWIRFQRDRHEARKRQAEPPGQRLADREMEVRGEPDAPVTTPVDLEPWLPDGTGSVVLWITPVPEPTERWRAREILTWVQRTRIGLTAFADAESLTVWATSLADGAPAAGVQLTLDPPGTEARSDARGLATIAFEPAAFAAGKPQAVVARKGTDAAILPAEAHYWSGSVPWRLQPRKDTLGWLLFDDRGIYRPGETARLKGWLRVQETGKGGDLRGLDGAPGQVRWRLRDSRGNEMGAGEAQVGALGGFDLEVPVPASANLGHAWLELAATGPRNLDGLTRSHALRIEEFRRPEFEVKVSAGPGPHVVGETAEAEIRASYYAGGGLASAPVTWSVSSRQASYRPPGHDDFHFGRWFPWWRPLEERFPWEPAGEVLTHEARTDLRGHHGLALDLVSVEPPFPWSVRAEGTVMDVNRQAWTGAATLLVHPASAYVGLKADRPFLEPGKGFDVQAVAVDIDGKPLAGRPLALRFARLEWTQDEGGEWTEVEKDLEERSLRSGAGPVASSFRPRAAGRHRLRAEVQDASGRRSRTEVELWVAGAARVDRGPDQEDVTLVPDRASYQPGEVAEVLLRSALFPAHGLLTLRRSGLVRAEPFTLEGPTRVLRVPVEEAFLPGIELGVDLVGTREEGTAGKGARRRPALASGSLHLKVPPLARKLAVDARAREAELAPGGETVVDVEVRDARGEPAPAAEVSILAVDEAVLALTGHLVPDPLAAFYPDRDPGVQEHHLRLSLLFEEPREQLTEGTLDHAPAAAGMETRSMMLAAEAAPGDGAAPAPPPVALRSDLAALALFVPGLRTDARGRAQVPLRLPDSLTRYRLSAVAVLGERQFGSGESSVTARKPLMLRPSPPRFLNLGDRAELSFVAQNQTGEPRTVDLAVRGANLSFAGARPDGAGLRFEVPARDRREVRLEARPRSAGTARFQALLAGAEDTDAVALALPVWTPATGEAFATYSDLAEGVALHTVKPPAGAWRDYGGLDVSTSSTALASLADAVLYLVAYPFECSEQIASRVLAVVALKDVLAAFHAPGLPPPAEIEAAVKRDLERLKSLQRPDGGFGFWSRESEDFPYLGVHVAHALARARAGDYPVDGRMLEASRRYLEGVEGRIPRWYSAGSRRSLVAYALETRRQLGDPDLERARRLLGEAGPEGLPLEALAWLLPTLGGGAAELEEALRQIGNRVTETAGTAHFATSYTDGAHVLLHSDRRADALVLEALLQVRPHGDLIPKIARGLLAHRTRGRWTNTQENAFVLLALKRYFEAREATTPDFVARAWLGPGLALEHAFRGRTTEEASIHIPMTWLLREGAPAEEPLTIAGTGPGRLYYRIGLRYSPRDLRLEAADHGFTVERRYEAVDAPGDVRREPDGTWWIRAGARVRVSLGLVTTGRRYHVALVDPLPAGLEPVNPDLAVSAAPPGPKPEPPEAPGGRWWGWGPWYQHQNLRDERVEAFTALLGAGVYRYDYTARATTPGDFVVPPARAEEMYAPETFGRSASDRVRVGEPAGGGGS